MHTLPHVPEPTEQSTAHPWVCSVSKKWRHLHWCPSTKDRQITINKGQTDHHQQRTDRSPSTKDRQITKHHWLHRLCYSVQLNLQHYSTAYNIHSPALKFMSCFSLRTTGLSSWPHTWSQKVFTCEEQLWAGKYLPVRHACQFPTSVSCDQRWWCTRSSATPESIFQTQWLKYISNTMTEVYFKHNDRQGHICPINKTVHNYKITG